MSLLVLTTRYVPVFSGAATQEHRVFRQLASRGLSAEVLTLAWPGLSKRERLDAIPISRAGSSSRIGLIRFAIACAWKIVRGSRPSRTVMAMSGGWGPWLGVWIANRLGNPTIVRLSLDGSDDPISIRKQRFGSIKLRLVRSAREIICLTPALVEKCRAADIPEERIRLLPNAVDLEIFQRPNEHEKAKTRQRLAIPGACKVAVFLGALLERKGILELLDVWKKIGLKHPRSLLILCGPASYAEDSGLDPRYLAQIHERIDAYGLKDRIRIMGMLGQSEARDCLWSADLYVSMSRAEGLANATLEAMAVGLPVLTLARPGELDGVITDGQEGWLIEPGASSNFLRAIDEAFEEPDLLARMGAAAHTRIEESFSLDGKVLEYQKLLARHGAFN